MVASSAAPGQPGQMILLVVLCTLLTCTVVALVLLGRRSARAHRRTREEAELLRELAKDRANRISLLSHEVRTPLALIRGAGELLEDEAAGPLTDQQRRFTHTITANCAIVIDLAEQLLRQARSEAQIFDLHLQRLELRSLVRDVVHELRTMHSARIQLDNHGRAITLDADPRLLREALWNLGNNAVRHAGDGATVTFRVQRGEGQAIVAVADDGRGMDPGTRKDIFEPFATSGEGGTGLGLPITKQIIDLHHGTVLVDTAARHGTVMYLTLPIEDGETEGAVTRR